MDNISKKSVSWSFLKGVFLVSLVVLIGSYFLSGYFDSRYTLNEAKKEFKYQCIIDGEDSECGYNLSYVSYDWSFKLSQLSTLKNIFTPLIISEVNGQDLSFLRTLDDFNTYAGIKYFVNSNDGESIIIRPNLYEEIPLIFYHPVVQVYESDAGKWISSHYYINDSFDLVRRIDNINDVYGSEDNFFRDFVNVMTFPLAMFSNLIYDLGVLVNFVINW